ncbi:MAG: DUF2254 domain-containing protein [Bacteriovoracia bacterium]
MNQNLSVRAGIFCLGAIVAALAAVTFAEYVPDDVASLLGGDAVDKILTILASSMLAVVTFSLSTLIASYSVAASGAPARATAMIMSDRGAQTALSAFLGAFIFSIVSLVALSTGYYGSKGRVILFGITIIVLTGVVWTVIRWIGQLSGLGQLANLIKGVERSTVRVIQAQKKHFAEIEEDTPVAEGELIFCEHTGFLQTLDLTKLTELLDGLDADIWIEVYPGQFMYPGLPMAKISKSIQVNADLVSEIRACFYVGRSRTFEDDPRFGFVVLSEIGSRALSPGINDPGTAVEIISSQLRLLTEFHRVCDSQEAERLPRNIHLKLITAEDVLDDAFQAIARDGAAMVEVGIALQKALGSLSEYPNFAAPARAMAKRNIEFSLLLMKSKFDRERLLRAASWRNN